MNGKKYAAKAMNYGTFKSPLKMQTLAKCTLSHQQQNHNKIVAVNPFKVPTEN